VFGSFCAWGRLEMQTLNMRNHFGSTGPATEIEAEQLVGAFGGGPPYPQTNEQAGDEGHIDLQMDAVRALTEQMAATQDTLGSTDKKMAMQW
jgi:hypothetical protein